MQDSAEDRRALARQAIPVTTVRRLRLAAASFVALAVGTVLAACSSSVENTLTIFADPGTYVYYSCEQIANQRRTWASRELELKMLMDKAEQGAGGAVVNVLAYKADHIAAGEQLKVLDTTARSKNCDIPSSWRSNNVIR